MKMESNSGQKEKKRGFSEKISYFSVGTYLVLDYGN